MLVAAVDGSTDTWHADVGASVLHVVTYTWNWYLQANLLRSVPDFGTSGTLGRHAGVPVHGRCALPAAAPAVGLLVVPRWLYLLFTWWRFHMEAAPSR